MKFLIVIDMQNDFIDGALPADGGKEIINKIKDKIVSDKSTVIFTKDTHYMGSYFKTYEGRNLPIPHCINRTHGWHIVKELELYAKRYNTIEKGSFGAEKAIKNKIFDLLPADDYIESIELVGVCTDICIISNALALRSVFINDIPIIVDSSCCAGTTKENHDIALQAMKNCMIEIK